MRSSGRRGRRPRSLWTRGPVPILLAVLIFVGRLAGGGAQRLASRLPAARPRDGVR